MKRVKCARCYSELYAHEGWHCPKCLSEIMSGGSKPGLSREALGAVVDFAILGIVVVLAFAIL